MGRHQHGLSLIELMISITLGLLILAALVAVFSQNSRSFKQNDSVAEMQDSARFALDSLSRDLSMAGYLGGVYTSANIVPSSQSNLSNSSAQQTKLVTDCGSADAFTGILWFLQAATRIEFQDNISGTSSSQFPCLSNVQPNTDIVAIRRAAGQSKADLSLVAGSLTPTLNANTFYLQTNGTEGTLIYTGNLSSSPGAFTLQSGAVPSSLPMSFYKWVPRMYFIQNYAHSPGDGIPALCRMELQAIAAPTMAAECLADGVQNLQIEWGLDTNNDCIPDEYPKTLQPGTAATSSTAAVPGQLALAVTARIWLLVRAPAQEASYTDTKTYTFANVTVGPANDHYRRRLYTTTVQLRNPITTSTPCSLP
jgi:Tfp pilus assembly protein PilW